MKNRSFLRSAIIPIALSSLIIIVPTIFYLGYFHSPALSNQFNDWVSFSNYLSPFATLFSGCTILFLTWYLHKNRAAIEKPLITFRRIMSSESGFPNYPFYEMVNGGSSSAVSCIVYIQKTGSNHPWESQAY
jgi:hypothetical protein